MEMTGGEAVALALETLGVRHVFGIVSVHNLPIYDAIARRGTITPIGVRHEQAAAHAADGYARATGELGVVIASTGPGHDQHHDGPVRGELRLVAGAAHHRADRQRLPGQGQGLPARGRAPAAHAVLALPAGGDGAPHRGHRPGRHRRGRGHPRGPAAAGGGGDPGRPAVPPRRGPDPRPPNGRRLHPRRRRLGQGGRGALGRDQAGAVGRRRRRQLGRRARAGRAGRAPRRPGRHHGRGPRLDPRGPPAVPGRADHQPAGRGHRFERRRGARGGHPVPGQQHPQLAPVLRRHAGAPGRRPRGHRAELPDRPAGRRRRPHRP